MIRRIVSLGVLALLAAGAVVAIRRVERFAAVATPEGFARTADSLIGAAQGFAGDVRTAAAHREAELRAAVLGGASDGDAQTARRARSPHTSSLDDDAPTRVPPSSRPGGLQAGDELDPLYDF
ncbi:MAG: hypothetical protein LBK72_03330 [Bifidobacteriaceae bacterium]|jgi:hypothetical protein|nr:hypothetical protein [Bifidobacteriaceae bacterium]